MSYIEYLNLIWELNRIERFKPAERDLLFYLLNECNKQYWRMPVCCSTLVICDALGLNKSTILRAREGLAKRGILRYTKGTRHYATSEYVIIITNSGVLETVCETLRATNNKDKDKNINIYRASEEGLSLDELQSKMKSDTTWQQSILDLIQMENKALPPTHTLNDYIDRFFSFLRIQGYEKREEKECRAHFYNKLIKDYLTCEHYVSDKS
ncbi:MAG: hypothetical protein LUD48_04655, partial [Prevotella sp.]|nr:hypothetical protein [Prevotella sp.]